MGTSFRQDSTTVTNISVIKDREVRLSVLTPLKCEPKMSCLSYIFFLCLIEKSRKQMNQVFLSNPSSPFTLNLRTLLRRKNCCCRPRNPDALKRGTALCSVTLTLSVTHHPWVPGA